MGNNGTSAARRSGIELLKCIAVLLIVMSHLLLCSENYDSPSVISLSEATENISVLMCIIIRYLGQLGNTIFIVCSSYFLIDSSRVKPEKVLTLLGINLSVNLIFALIFIVNGVEITLKELIRSFFPTILANNWFVTCYIIFYLIHPFLNIILRNVTQAQLLTINIFCITAYSFFQMVRSGVLYYNALIGFIVIYFITAYMKKYLKNISLSLSINIFAASISLLGLIILILATNFLGLHINYLNDKMLHWKIFINPFIIIFALSVFNIFSKMDFISKAVNYLSSLSMIIYIVHENILLQTYTRPYVFDFIYKYTVSVGVSYENNIAWISLCVAIITFFIKHCCSNNISLYGRKIYGIYFKCNWEKMYNLFQKFIK